MIKICGVLWFLAAATISLASALGHIDFEHYETAFWAMMVMFTVCITAKD